VIVGDVLVRDGVIVAVGKLPESTVARSLDAKGCAVVPGFVQAHVHLCQALFRGMADDLPLMVWLRKRIWPLEAAHDARSIGASARLGLLEMMRAFVASEAERQIVSVRFHGLIREEDNGVAEPFDEVWHLVKPADGSREWAIAGIQQTTPALA
jgi:cytosine/adenosine deaminase-related metal-dependent hydrolase